VLINKRQQVAVYTKEDVFVHLHANVLKKLIKHELLINIDALNTFRYAFWHEKKIE
jgi:hypothetical protein